MTVSIHQPAIFPWLGLISKIQQSDLYICLDTVQYSKNSFDNRNRILINNTPHWITFPIKTSGKNKEGYLDLLSHLYPPCSL